MSECPLGRWAHGGIQKQRLEGLGAVRPNWSRAGASVPGRAESWAWILGEQTRHNSHGDAPGRAAARADSPGPRRASSCQPRSRCLRLLWFPSFTARQAGDTRPVYPGSSRKLAEGGGSGGGSAADGRGRGWQGAQTKPADVPDIVTEPSEIAVCILGSTSPNLQRIQIILTLETKT